MHQAHTWANRIRPAGRRSSPIDAGSKWLGNRDSNPNYLIHDLRHAAASLLLAQGVPPRVVMEILGHSQIATTKDLCSHVMPAAHQEAATLMDRILATGS